MIKKFKGEEIILRILILGGDGMLGHKLLLHLSKVHEVKVTLRHGFEHYRHIGIFNPDNAYTNIDVVISDNVLRVLSMFKPDVVVNAIGVIKQRNEAKDVVPCLEINALFPHKLALYCDLISARLITISTDCVFSGSKGNYVEHDIPDAEDFYGRTKALGEVVSQNCLTIRTSIIGLELFNKTGLIEWFLSQKGAIRGYTKMLFSGVTTAELSRIIDFLCVKCSDLSGLYHIASEPISKCDLLKRLATKLQRNDLVISPDDSNMCDRSLKASNFYKQTGYEISSWDEMLDELSEEIKQRTSSGT